VQPRIRAFGEAALLVEFGETPNLALNAQVHALARSLDQEPLLGQANLVPGYVSLLVEFDPMRVELEQVQPALQLRVAQLGAKPPPVGRHRVIPTVYGGDYGPDLDQVAARLRLSARALVERHTRTEQTVYMLGFSPGFPYLGDLPDELALPRRDTPRERVAIGSVAIAERQTGIYSREMPGGWHLLGRTPIQLFDPARDPPAYLAPGDQVRFVAIAETDWERHVSAPDDW
jgi:KipI family sensor histidine kinase inhibitor